tara:strand:- start:1255 stop:2046 length:792 start_codon:yes stop_codon:yes gene_type:complete
MIISDFVNSDYINPNQFAKKYNDNNPFPHIVFDNFFKKELIEKVLLEFPDLSKLKDKFNFTNINESKFTSKGMKDLSYSAFNLISILNSDVFLNYLQTLTGIKEKLFSDPYLVGGGYHEIKKDGFLEVHADFNKYNDANMDRRINLLLYLNHNWDPSWNGNLQLYDKKNLKEPIKMIPPEFNRCVIFSTTSYTFHGHPEKLNCPEDTTRKSIALYYYSYGRPLNEISKTHGTVFRKDNNFIKDIVKDITPPIVSRFFKKNLKK